MKQHPLIPLADDPKFPPVIRERLRISDESALRNVQIVSDRMGDDFHDKHNAKLLALSKSSAPAWIRLRELYGLAEEFTSKVGTNAACRRDCSHCCHVGVAVKEVEAKMMGAKLKLKVKTGFPKRDLSKFDYGYHNPCTFLKDGECSIYEDRPFICRTLYNMDTDALLCELRPPLSIPVPYLNTTKLALTYMLICGPKTRLGDIRDYFPRSKKP